MRARARLGVAGVCALVAAAGLWGVVDAAPEAMPALGAVLRMLMYAAVSLAAFVGVAACLFGPVNLMDMSPAEIWRWFWSRTPSGVMARAREMLGMGTRRGK